MKPRRLDQLLSSLGYASRREVKRLLDTGEVQIDGVDARRGDERVDPALVTVEGQPLEAPEGLLAMLYKPLGYTCTHTDKEGPTIYELLPERWIQRNPVVTSVGRLDKETSGLILLTDQGHLVQRFTSPKSVVEKVYIATVDQDLDPMLIETFASGTLVLESENDPCLPARLELLDPRTARLTITEGRYHQVRRMFASQGWHVELLHRERFGPYDLGDLRPEQWKLLPLPVG